MKSLCAGAFACVVLVAFARQAVADGVAYYHERDGTSFATLRQLEQRAVIVHRGGVERLLIAINVDLADDAAGLWAFPIPGQPEVVAVDLVDTFPVLQGRNPIREARNRLGDLMFAVRLTHI